MREPQGIGSRGLLKGTRGAQPVAQGARWQPPEVLQRVQWRITISTRNFGCLFTPDNQNKHRAFVQGDNQRSTVKSYFFSMVVYSNQTQLSYIVKFCRLQHSTLLVTSSCFRLRQPRDKQNFSGQPEISTCLSVENSFPFHNLDTDHNLWYLWFFYVQYCK